VYVEPVVDCDCSHSEDGVGRVAALKQKLDAAFANALKTKPSVLLLDNIDLVRNLLYSNYRRFTDSQFTSDLLGQWQQ